MKVLSCDWGTSNFRLYLLESNTLACLGQVSSPAGVGVLRHQINEKGVETRAYFLSFLQEQIALLAEEIGEKLEGLPLLISGMASSSIGFVELPYAQLPFRVTGEDIVHQKIEASPTFNHTIYLFSGLQSPNDVMRGEETQVIGMQHNISSTNAILILPGTHSKHIHIQNKQVVDFSTFMTGELFQLTSQQSVLSHSVQSRSIDDQESIDYFKQGVSLLKEGNYLASLFQARTNTLLKHFSPTQNYCFLSGMHIGYEMSSLQQLSADTQIVICAGDRLALLYRTALASLGISNKSYVIPNQQAKMATSFGHLAMLPQLITD